jgi:signal transduction histidine kinase
VKSQMASFLATQSVWLVPVLLGLLVLVSVVLVLVLSKAGKAARVVDTREEDTHRFFNEKSELELRLAEQADRMRMIAEVHDAAAVSITSLISQAEGARFGATADPQLASRAAAAIADSARLVLNDIRRVVNSSRDGVAEVDTMPSLVSIHDLFTAMNESGIIVRFEETGTPFAIAPSAELAIFRILQEGLNNARSHGGPGTSVKVSMGWSAQGLQLRLDDDGTRAKRRFADDASGAYTASDDQAALVEILSGRGMRDMKNRTEAFGGVFSAHRVPGVGFSVSAAFPTLRFHNGIHGVNVQGTQATERSVG